jgi:hypothetical protein
VEAAFAFVVLVVVFATAEAAALCINFMVSSREDIVFAGFMPDVDAPDISDSRIYHTG